MRSAVVEWELVVALLGGGGVGGEWRARRRLHQANSTEEMYGRNGVLESDPKYMNRKINGQQGEINSVINIEVTEC